MRKYYWYISIFLRKHGLVVFGSIIAAVILFTLASPLLVRLFDIKKTTYIGVIGHYSLDNLPPYILRDMSHGLTKIQPDGSVIPDLTERWNTEDDGKTYRFLLKKNIFWQDGKPFVSNDVHFNFSDLQTFPSANEVVFKLKSPFVVLPSVVSQPLIRIVDQPYFFFFKKKKVIGIGDNDVSGFVQQGSNLTELTINTKDEHKVYRFYLTEDDALSAFKRGDVDVLNDMSTIGDLQSWPNVSINKKLDTSTYLAIFFYTQDDIFKSNNIRQALNYALPKPTDESRATGPINPTSWAYANVAKPYDFDTARAIERLVSPLVIPHTPIHFTLTTTPTFNTDAELIKKAWEDFGVQAANACQKNSDIKDKSLCENVKIQVDIKVSNFPDTNDFQALLTGEQSPTDPDQYALWDSTQATNFTKYKNVKIDGLLEKGRETEDQKKRYEIYSQFEESFSEDQPAIFIRYLTKYDIRRKGK